jgi:hypothetical protein
VAAVAVRPPLEDLEDDPGHVVEDIADALAATPDDLALGVEQIEPEQAHGGDDLPRLDGRAVLGPVVAGQLRLPLGLLMAAVVDLGDL